MTTSTSGRTQVTKSSELLFGRAARHDYSGRTALIEAGGSWTYADLIGHAEALSGRLLAGRSTLAGARVCYLIPPGRAHVAALWGTWMAGGLAVPLAISHPGPELEYVLQDADPELVVLDPRAPYGAALADIADRRAVSVVRLPLDGPAPAVGFNMGAPPRPSDPALMVYTSGTTGRPKGVVTTHANVAAQVRSLEAAWGWSADDHILHVLPLHHVHGIVNVLGCALWSGAVCEFGSSGPGDVWERLARGGITLFMAVPTIYGRLIRAWEEAPENDRSRWSRGAAGLRLTVSGSAALPVPTLERWREITGHTLLERYGMTETGMILSNPLHGERRPGCVGQPLPGIEVRLVDPSGTVVEGEVGGEIEVRGPQVFSEYWSRPEDTSRAFRDGWFRTGDESCLTDGYYRILGRQSVDILKTGGHKVSALEIEGVYRNHPDIRDLAVVGVPDPDWGERICAAWVSKGDIEADAGELRDWGKDRLAPYKVPREFKRVDELPRNAMGKVRKPALASLFSGSGGDSES